MAVPFAVHDCAVVLQFRQLLEKTNRFVKSTFPHVEFEAFAQVRCLYSSTPDHDFVLDQLPQHPNIAVAAGFSGRGTPAFCSRACAQHRPLISESLMCLLDRQASSSHPSSER
jgi:hypothetical protein